MKLQIHQDSLEHMKYKITNGRKLTQNINITLRSCYGNILTINHLGEYYSLTKVLSIYKYMYLARSH